MKKIILLLLLNCYVLSGIIAAENFTRDNDKDKIVMPEFPGGTAELHKYLLTETNYPLEAREKGEIGEVVVAFSVGVTGNISGVRVIKSVSEALDREAIRVISGMPKWKPGTKNGKRIRAELTIPINFKVLVESDKYVIMEGENEGGGIWKESARDKKNRKAGIKKL